MEFLVTLSALLLCAASGRAQPYHRNRFAPAPIGHDGRVVDTPEVAQAKAAHLAAFSMLASSGLAAPYNGAPDHHRYAASPSAPAVYGPQGAYSNPSYFSSRIQHGHYGYRGPPAPLAHDGRVLDTPEVAQAKAAHFAAFSHAASRAYDPPGAYNNEEHNSGAYRATDDEDNGSNEAHYEASAHYRGQPAPLAHDGRVVDTPEVAHAKAAHLALIQRASHGRRAPAPNAYYGDY